MNQTTELIGVLGLLTIGLAILAAVYSPELKRGILRAERSIETRRWRRARRREGRARRRAIVRGSL